MKVSCLFRTLLLLWLGTAVAAAAPADPEHDLFEQTKARADKGDAQAQLRLGALYASGTGVTKDLKKAARWHRKAAEQGLAQGQYQLGLDYAEGEGLKPDEEEAVKWFRRAADQGLMEAQLDLGLCYENGNGLRPNGVEAVKLFRLAAAQGMARAEYELGKCYLEGTGVSKDIAEGIKWVQQAAERGDPKAENRMGQAYEKGEGVTRDYIQAYKWFALAAAQDDENVNDLRVSLAKVETLLNKDQVAEAQRLAREFKPGLKPAITTVPGAGHTNTLDHAATPGAGADIGFVNVKADDNQSEVFVDGAFVGNPPTRLKLAQGSHVVEVKRPGCKAYRRELNVGAGSDLNLQVTLEKQ